MNFKRLFSGVALVSLLVGASVVQATDIKNYPRVAVMNFGNKAITSQGLRDQDFSSATEYAIYQLSASGWFDLIDYEQLSTIANMHSINMSGLVDPSTTVEIGKFAGAEYMVVGYLTGLTTKENVLGYQHGDKGSFDNAQHVVTANVAVRIVDIKTGRIIVAGLGKGSSTSTYTELKFTKYRNRKIETEDISNTVTRDQKNEYTRNSNTTSNQSNTYDKNKKNTQNTTRTDDFSNSTTKENKVTNQKENSITNTNTINKEKNNQSNDKQNISKKVTTDKSANGNLAGDVNCDGVVNKGDLDILSQVIVGNYEFDYDFTNADINGDGQLTSTDLSDLRLIIEGKYTGSVQPSLSVDSENLETANDITKDTSISDSTIESGTVESKKTDSKTDESTDSNTNSNSSNVTSTNENETTETQHSSNERNSSVDETINKTDNVNTVLTNNKNIYYERDQLDYVIRIGTVEVSDIQVRNAISKAVRDAIYGNMGIMTTLNNGKKLKIKTGF